MTDQRHNQWDYKHTKDSHYHQNDQKYTQDPCYCPNYQKDLHYYQNDQTQKFGNQYPNENKNIQYQDQMQLKLQKMSLAQAQKLKNCHDVLMRLLFSAENYALYRSKDKIFGEYDRYDNTSNKTPLELKYQFVEQLDSFNGALATYIHLYPNGFFLPVGLNKKFLIEKIKEWKSRINEKPVVQYYDMLLKLINGNRIRDLYNDLERIDLNIDEEKEKTGNTQKEETQKIEENRRQNFVNNYAEASYDIAKELDNIDSYYNKKNGEYNYRVKLGGTPGKGFKYYN